MYDWFRDYAETDREADEAEYRMKINNGADGYKLIFGGHCSDCDPWGENNG